MKKFNILCVVSLISLLSACATQPKDTSHLDAKINEVTAGDFAQFMYHESLAEENLAEARKIRQWMQDDHYWNINLEDHAIAATDRALKHRKQAEVSFTHWAEDWRDNWANDWHDRCQRHPDYCTREELLTVAYFPTAIAKASSIKQKSFARILALAKTHHLLDIEVIGYTDTVGGTSYNIGLAKRRARSIYKMLLKKGVNSHVSIKQIPFGEAGGTDNTENQKNRRVDVHILSYQPFPK